MIARIWHGWTSKVNADKYWDILSNQVLPGIANMKINGYQGVKVLKRSVGNEEEFITIMEFDSLDSVRQFVGEDYERAHVPEPARRVLSRFDERSQHYEVIGRFDY